MNPFDYPESPHVRRHCPRGYSDPESYRPWLRDEFAFRCVFCLVRERWENRVARFAIDHLRPVSRYPQLATTYENLLYVCTSCNALKGDREVPDPTEVFLSSTVQVTDEGVLIGATPQAAKLINWATSRPQAAFWRNRVCGSEMPRREPLGSRGWTRSA